MCGKVLQGTKMDGMTWAIFQEIAQTCHCLWNRFPNKKSVQRPSWTGRYLSSLWPTDTAHSQIQLCWWTVQGTPVSRIFPVQRF